MEHHPYARIFPMLSDEAIQSLADDIIENGLRVPILIDTHERIIDGRNRAAACAIAQVEPIYEPFVGTDAEILKLVISLNLKRRHLTDSQQSMIGADISNLAKGSNRFEKKPVEVDGQICPSTVETPTVTVDEAAELVGVSPRLVKTARKVKAKGVPELQDAVVAGEISVSHAAEIADEPEEKQRETVREIATPKPREQKPEQQWPEVMARIERMARGYAKDNPPLKPQMAYDLRQLSKEFER